MKKLIACVKEHPEVLAIGLLVLALAHLGPAVSRAPELAILTHPLVEGKSAAVLHKVSFGAPADCAASALARGIERMNQRFEKRQRALWERLEQRLEGLQERIDAKLDGRSTRAPRPPRRALPGRLSLRSE